MNSCYKFFYVYILSGILLLISVTPAYPYEMATGDATITSPETGDAPITSLEIEDEPITSLEIVCDDALLLPGIPCVLSLQASYLADIQYSGLELRYDATRLAFLQERPGSVFDGNAITIARHLPDGRLGVSVSSTTGERQADGVIVHLDFVIRVGAPDGTATFSLDYLEFTDRDGSPRPAPLPEAIDINIPPYLQDAGITGPGPVTIARGSELLFSFRLASSGITVEELSDPERFTAEMVIIDADLWDGSSPIPDPSVFDRVVPLSYTGTSGGQFRFEAPFPPDQPVGKWQVAAFFQLEDHPELVAGYGSEGGGLLDNETFTAVEVTVSTPRVTVAEWTFDGEQWTADTGLFNNLQPDTPAKISLLGARFSGWTSGNTGRAPNSNNWHQEVDDNHDNNDNHDSNSDHENGGGDSENGDTGNGPAPVHDKYWQARLTTEGYHELALQFRMNGSGTGPRDFHLYYSIDGEPANGSDGWQPIPDGDFQVGTSWTQFTMNLPEDAADMSELFLRWVRTGNTSIAGNEIGPTGTNRLDDVRITGIPLDTEEIWVWPGNTRGEGTVTEADVLNLALYWMSTGPERVPRSIAWSPQPVVRWVPESAAHADTDGDGRVGYRDLLAIGRNFDLTVEAGSQKVAAKTAIDDTDVNPAQQGLSTLSKSLPVLSALETVSLVLQSADPVPLAGISARFFLEQLPPDAWELVEFEPGYWAKDWQTRDLLIRFHHGRTPETLQEYVNESEAASGIYDKTVPASDGTSIDMQSDTRSNTWSAAWAHAGPAAPIHATELFTLTIRARTDWDTAPVVHLQRTSLSGPEGLEEQPDTRNWKLIRKDRSVNIGRDPFRDIPLTTRLHANYPNPFNPSTNLSFDLHQTGNVRISVYDALGRRIAILADTQMDAGRHELTWDATHLASGMYLVRMETPHTTQTRKVTLMK